VTVEGMQRLIGEATLQTLTAPSNALERELLTEVKLLLLSIKEDSDLICEPEGSDCKGGCVKRFVVNHLKVTGYDAGVCKSKWLSSGRVPGGSISCPRIVKMCGIGRVLVLM
jgi:hypothetical protein